jgi:hypothetical protein
MVGEPGSYWALVKFEARTENANPIVSFKHYVSDTKEMVARFLAEDFEAIVDVSLQYEEVDNETIGERERLKALFKPFRRRVQNRRVQKIRAMETTVVIGSVTRVLSVVSEGERAVFFTTFPVALEHDGDFQQFQEGAGREHEDGPGQELGTRLKRIKDKPVGELTDVDVGGFLQDLEKAVLVEGT